MDTLYALLLLLHSYLRWLVIGLGVATVVLAARGLATKRAFGAADNGVNAAFIGAVDAQLLFGLVLYLFASPITSAAFHDLRGAMKDPTLRFYGVEHPTAMLVCVAWLHIVRARTKRLGTEVRRHRAVLLGMIAPVLIIVATTPWPPMKYGRPLFRGVAAFESGERGAPSASCPSVYAARCAACHGAAGAGDGVAAPSLRPPPRDFRDPAWQERETDDDLRTVITKGGRAHGLSAAMPAHGDLTPQEVQSLVDCLRSFRRQ